MAIAGATALAIAVIIFLAYTLRPPKVPLGSPEKLKEWDWPIVGALGFWTKRSEFFQREGKLSRSGAFSFHVGSKHVIGLSAREQRTALMDMTKMDLAEGHSFLFGTVPQVKGQNGEELVTTAGFGAWFLRQLRGLFDAKYLENKTPLLMTDANARLDALAHSQPATKVYDAFNLVYPLIFQLTNRAVGANEITDDWEWQAKTQKRFFIFEETFHPLYAVLPWLPTFTKMKKYYNALRIYLDVKGIYDKRKTKCIREDDALQYIIDKGETADATVAFFVTAVFAGQINSALNCAFCLYALALHPEWMSKVRDEIRDVVSRHAVDKDATLVEQISSLPFPVWMSEFKLMKQCLDESIRHTLFGAVARKNIAGHDVTMNGNVFIPRDSYVVASFSQTHLDPSIFPEPEKWDPARFSPERTEHKKVPGAFLGWGAGRHVCGGIEFAQLEICILLALLLARFDVEACHNDGRTDPRPALPPMPIDAWGPSAPSKPYFVKLTRREKV